jgi:hypothetical protein
MILAYWKFAERYYGFSKDGPRGDRYCLRSALKILRSLYGRTLARDFGPRALKACRQKMRFIRPERISIGEGPEV